MKIVAWNLAHQTIERPIRAGFAEAVHKLLPDVLTLNEYVHGGTRDSLLRDLAAAGLSHVLVSDRVGKNNQVLVASRYPIVAGDLKGPTSEKGASESNFLHVLVPSADLEIVGVRAPAYERAELHSYWEGLLSIVRKAKARKIIFIGDLNTDPDATRRPTSGYLRGLRGEGWCVTSPRGTWSFYSGTRIDHAILSPSVSLIDARYVDSINEIILASSDRAARVSDHAALEIQVVSLKNEVSPPL